MKSITLWFGVLACLLVAAQAIQLPNIEEPEEDVLDELDNDEDVYMGTLLYELFQDDEIDEDDDDDDEEETGRQLAEVNTSQQERNNAFMDTFLSQLKRQVKRDLEPLKVTLTPAKKSNKNGKKLARKNSKKNTKKEEKSENRNPKEVKLPEIADFVKDLHQIQKREAEAEEEVTGRQTNNGNNKDKRKNKKKNKNGGKKNKNNKKGKKRSMNKVVLNGLSHIAREGDVKLYNMKNGRTLVTELVFGPVELDITRTFGSGEESKAAASASQIKGRMKLKINKEGKPKIKQLKIKGPNPNDITISGSVARINSNSSGKSFFKKSMKQVSPTAAKKLLKAAKAVIQSV